MRVLAMLLLSLAIGANAVAVETDSGDVVFGADEPGLTLPKLKHHTSPTWPSSVPFGTQARVRLQARIAADGTVVATHVLEATDSRFADEARRTVSRWRYAPAMKDGRPVDVLLEVVIDWRGRGANRTAALVHRVAPVYPESMIQERMDGEVELEVRVGTDGTPRAVRVLDTDDPRFTTPAIEAVRQWRFDPAWAKDEPVETTERVTVEFSWREARRQLQRKAREASPIPGAENE